MIELSPGGQGPARSRDRNERGETAMHVAAIKGDQDGIKKLLEQGMGPNVSDFAGMSIENQQYATIYRPSLKSNYSQIEWHLYFLCV